MTILEAQTTSAFKVLSKFQNKKRSEKSKMLHNCQSNLRSLFMVEDAHTYKFGTKQLGLWS